MLRNVLRTVSFALCAALCGAGASASPSIVSLGGFAPGTIVVKQGERSLYLTLQGGAAIRYPVAVGKAGKAWRGRAQVQGKYVNPSWSPPAEVKHDKPWLPDVIEGGAANNPMGGHALTLSGGEYAIHGTTRAMRASIGTAASYGCIRMYNEDIADLFWRVQVGTPVAVLP
jgi:lipoprotein-anchoring transpeptidase ErfK/SrfK